MQQKKRGFTLVETLFAFTILGMVAAIGLSAMSGISTILYEGQTESRNRRILSDNIFYITREIQSAEAVMLSADGKVMKIKQHGSGGFTLEYEIRDGSPTGTFNFKGKKMFDVDYEQSCFLCENERICLKLAVYKNNLSYNQTPQVYTLEVAPRTEVLYG